jgi:hypothetical protein
MVCGKASREKFLKIIERDIGTLPIFLRGQAEEPEFVCEECIHYPCTW